MNGGAEVNHAVAEGSVVLQLPKRAADEIDQVIVLELGTVSGCHQVATPFLDD